MTSFGKKTTETKSLEFIEKYILFLLRTDKALNIYR